MREFSKKTILVLVMALMITGFGFAFGNKEIPEIPPVTSGTQYISPNGDGVQDSAVLKFSVKVYVKSDEGYVPEYGIQILDSSENVLKEVKETEKSDIGWFASIFKGYQQFTLEREISWDGTDLQGNGAPDGIYKVKLFVIDSSGNKSETDVDNFIVDTVKPAAVLVPPASMVFSPNGDGNLDTFIIKHTQATEEKLWEGFILDSAGNTVRSYKWENGRPGTVAWDGKNDSGANAAPGTYSYALKSTDLAGNASDPINLEGITLDTTETKVAIVVENPYFSPNGDGVKDSTRVFFDEHVKTGIKSWEWNLADLDGKIYLEASGSDTPPEDITLDGQDSEGSPMPEGMYRINYLVTYLNGNKPTTSEDFFIDVTPPEIKVTVDNPVFSPDGDGKKDSVAIQLKSNEIVTWEGKIVKASGETVLAKTSNQTTSLIIWDGKDENGNRVVDGGYSISGIFTDRAGNATTTAPQLLTVDTKQVSIRVAAGEGFSPNRDGNGDTEKIVIDTNQYDNVDYWSLEIVDSSGETVKSFNGKDFLPDMVEWDGTTAQGTAPEGTYTAVLSAAYRKGVYQEQPSNSFVLDVTPPHVALEAAPDPFARTDSGIEGDVFVTLNVQDNTRVRQWTMDIMDKTGDILRTYSGEGDPSGDITWKVAAGGEAAKVPAGGEEGITLKLTVFDEGSNTAVYEKNVPIDILLVMKNGRKYISVPNIIFGAYKYTLGSAGTKFLNRNNESLDRIARIYKKYPGYGLILEGHALDIYLGTPRQEKEENILVPLTQHRAETVKAALLKRGMDESKIAVEFYGGLHPVASVTDRTVWWKNRRVEFVMTDPE